MSAAGVDARPLRVASYNIRHGVGTDGRLDLPRTAAALTALEADVVGLQEVDDTFGDRSDFEDQTARLAQMTGMAACFGATLDHPPAAGQPRRRRYGLAVLSRHPISGHEMHLLPGHPARPAPQEPRGMLRAELQLPGPMALTMLVTHLANDDSDHRTAQVLEILRRTEDLRDAEEEAAPAVLVGDLNADPAHAELAPLAASGWRDAAAEAAERPGRGARPGSVVRAARSLHRFWPTGSYALAAALPRGSGALRATFSARWPLRRIDSIWVRGDLEVARVDVAATLASDHRPLVATLRLDGTGAGR